MTVDAPVLYNTNLSKAQGLVPETLELLQLWAPGMSAVDLKARVKETGALARSTDTRISDVVTRGFAQPVTTSSLTSQVNSPEVHRVMTSTFGLWGCTDRPAASTTFVSRTARSMG